MNQVISVQSTIHSNHSLQSVTPLINRFVDYLLVKIFPAGSQSVFEIVQLGNRNSMHALLQPPIQHSQWFTVQVRAVGDHLFSCLRILTKHFSSYLNGIISGKKIFRHYNVALFFVNCWIVSRML